MDKEFVTLYELQTMLREGIEGLFPSKVWVRAEIGALKARPGGHCYMELSQNDESGLSAKVQAVVWSSRYRFLSAYFESVTGSPLAAGMSVLVQVQVTYSQLYGLSLSVNDIDPEYTLGDRERARRETVARLEAEGLMDMQKSLALPALPRRFAVISASDAAGYRDFMRHLHENPYGFAFETVLFPALMQGAGCPESVASALEAAAASGGFDMALILRGGGSGLDLSCYDDYVMCAGIARCPLPVFTAVGHDQDYHVCDMAAFSYLKTPTALADEIVGWYADEDARIEAFRARLRLAFSSKIGLMESRLALLESRIKGADPRNVISRGYALAVDGNGTVVKGVSGRRPGDAVSLMFADGTLECTVVAVSEKNDENK